jgi:glycosyltransferase involved in cell wall biosynthesis
MNIVMVCSEYPPTPHGGIGTFVQMFARDLVKRGHGVDVVGLGDADKQWDDMGVHVRTIASSHMPALGGLVNRLRLLRVLRKTVQARNADIVEVPEHHGLLPFRFGLCPVVVRLHLSVTTIEERAGRRPGPVVKFCERMLLQRHGYWIAVSRHAMALTETSFPSVRPRRWALIYYPVAVNDPSGRVVIDDVPGDYILYAGAVSTRKGARLLADAAATLLRDYTNLHVVYVGRLLEEDGKQIDASIREGLPPDLVSRFHFMGSMSRERTLQYMRGARIFCFPSVLETFGLVVAEAMLVGTPVVVTDVDPFREFVNNDETGLLALPDASHIAAQIKRLLDDPELAARIATAGQRAIRERFSVDLHTAKSIEFYELCRQDWSGARP